MTDHGDEPRYLELNEAEVGWLRETLDRAAQRGAVGADLASVDRLYSEAHARRAELDEAGTNELVTMVGMLVG